MSTTLKQRIAKLEQQQPEPEPSQPRTLLEEVKAAMDRLTQRQRQADARSAAEDQQRNDYMTLVKALENPEFAETLKEAAELVRSGAIIEEEE